MKKTFFFCLLGACLALCSCQKTQQEQAEELVEKYLQENLNDPSSYELMEFGNLGKLTPMSIAFVDITNKCKELGYSMDSVPVILDRFKAIKEKEGSDPYEVIGWELSHKYRAKNAFGSLVINTYTYTFDKDITRIEGVKRK